MVTCPHCSRDFKLTGKKKTPEEIKSLRFAKAWKQAVAVLKDYNDGYAIMWLARKYESDKRIIRRVLQEQGVVNFRGRKGIPAWNKGLDHLSDERILKWSGPKNKNWKGGVTELNMKVRRCKKYQAWVRLILQRDNWTCKVCEKRGGDLEVDHYPVLFSQIMQTVTSFKEAMESNTLWNTENGRTLCKKCHNETRRSFNTKKNWSNNLTN